MPLSLNWSPFNYHVKCVSRFTRRASVSASARPAYAFSSVGEEKIEFKFLRV